MTKTDKKVEKIVIEELEKQGPNMVLLPKSLVKEIMKVSLIGL